MPISKETALTETASQRDPEKSEVLAEAGADLGFQYLAQHGVVEYTAEEESKVRWKIDLALMPIVSSFI